MSYISYRDSLKYFIFIFLSYFLESKLLLSRTDAIYLYFSSKYLLGFYIIVQISKEYYIFR
jgi:hypothetical protein